MLSLVACLTFVLSSLQISGGVGVGSESGVLHSDPGRIVFESLHRYSNCSISEYSRRGVTPVIIIEKILRSGKAVKNFGPLMNNVQRQFCCPVLRHRKIGLCSLNEEYDVNWHRINST